jgi:hypothetical protein
MERQQRRVIADAIAGLFSDMIGHEDEGVGANDDINRLPCQRIQPAPAVALGRNIRRHRKLP